MAEATRYALIDAAGTVANVILWDGETPYAPAEGETLVPAPETIAPGWSRLPDGTFLPPPETPQD